MNAGKLSAETAGGSITKASERTSNVVFQPQKLKEVVDIIDLMGNVASRVREDKSGDMGGGGTGGQGSQQGGTGGTSARDEAIAKAPPAPIMQKKLIAHLEREVRLMEKQTRRLARSHKPGSAFLLSELYKKIRRLTSLISDLLKASTNMIKRFYISVFIDHQPLVVSGGTLEEEEE